MENLIFFRSEYAKIEGGQFDPPPHRLIRGSHNVSPGRVKEILQHTLSFNKRELFIFFS